jgi:hypothetical protein
VTDERYATGIRLFQERHWFECHEVLELLWRETPRGRTRDFLQGLIQLAVSLEHWRRGNPRGAAGQWQKATARLAGLPPVYEGLAIGELLESFARLWERVGLEAAVLRQEELRTQATAESPALPSPTCGAAAPGSASRPSPAGAGVPILAEAWPTPRWADG